MFLIPGQFVPTFIAPCGQEAAKHGKGRDRKLGGAEARCAWQTCILFLYFSLHGFLHILFGGKEGYHLGKHAILLKMTAIKNNVLKSQPFQEVYQSFLLDLV